VRDEAGTCRDSDGDGALELAATRGMATANGDYGVRQMGMAMAGTRWGSCEPGSAPPSPVATAPPLSAVVLSQTEQGRRQRVGAAEQRRATALGRWTARRWRWLVPG
jgi:hypothetical protein